MTIYYVAMLTDEGKWKYLDNAPTYEDADMLVDKYADMYPYAMVDVVEANV